MLIEHPDGTKGRLTLDKQEVVELALQKGTRICAKKCISGNGEFGASDYELVPEYIASNEAANNITRSGSPTFDILSIDATSVDIFLNGVFQSTQTLIPGQVTTHTSPTANGNYYLSANGDIIVQKKAGNTNDSGTILKPSNDIIGWASTTANMSSNPINQTFDAYHVNTNGATTQSTQTTHNVLNFNDFSNFANTEDEYYEPTSALRILGNGLYGSARGDSDGGNDTALLPLEFMTDTHLIPQPAEFIAMVSDHPANVTITEPNGTITNIILTKLSTDVQAPYSGRVGVINNTANFEAGTLLESDVPIHVVYQPEDAGAFGSDSDETISFGWNKN